MVADQTGERTGAVMKALTRLKKDPITVFPEHKVLKAGEYLAYETAQTIIQTAHAQAQQITAEAKEIYKSEKRRGYQDGIAASKAEMAERMTATVARTIDYMGGVETAIADIVMTALNKILGERDDATLVLKTVRNALQVFCHRQRVTLRVAPALLATLEQKRASDFPDMGFLDIVPAAHLTARQCILETEMGMVDASIDTQLDAIAAAMAKRLGTASFEQTDQQHDQSVL